jgi:glycosyltransferase involved in cell wall biosynthesis
MLRGDMGLDGKFTLATIGANNDLTRKGFFELYQAFAAFRVKHPDSRLLLHSEMDGQFDHPHWITELGLAESVLITDTDTIKLGVLDDHYMASWYNQADAYLCPSWGEGFGVPNIEAQACGLPVIGTDGSAVTELVDPGIGWRVPSELKLNPLHKRSWRAPWIKGLEQAMVKAHTAWKRGGAAWLVRQEKARGFAGAYDTDVVYETYWKPVLKRLEDGEWKAKPDG